MASKVSFKITINEKFTCPEDTYNEGVNDDEFKPAYKSGQLIFVEDLGKIYLDFHGLRKCYTPISTIHNGLNYIGISETDPITVGVTIDGQLITPSEKDMVVFGTKEYIYRDGTNGLEWYELGNESSPAWEDDITWGDETGNEG